MKKQTKNTASNVHVVDFTKQRNKKTKKTETTETFESLSNKLESQINEIEKDLKYSIEELENDVNNLYKKNSKQNLNKEFKKEFSEFSKVLENRIKKTIATLNDQAKSKTNKEELKFIKNLTSQLVNILSFDFYNNVVSKFDKESLEKQEVDEFGMDASLIQKVKPVFDFLYYKYWRVETTGINNIPNEGRSLLVGNHSGTVPYDGSMLACAIANEHPVRKDARFLVEDFVFHMPILGSFINRTGGIRACQENAERLLSSDHLVIVFPEGVKGIGKYYNQRYKLQRFGRGGFIKLCIKTKSPLIPVGIVGAEEIHPIIFNSNILAKSIGVPYLPITPTFPFLGLLGVLPLPTKWSIHFGKPLSFDKHTKSSLDDELMIHKLSEKVREDIQDILVDLLKKRKSVWMG